MGFKNKGAALIRVSLNLAYRRFKNWFLLVFDIF